MPRNITRPLLVLAAGAALAVAAPRALAQEKAGDGDKAKGANEEFQRIEEREPRAGTPLIANKLYPMQFRLELSGIFDYSFNDKYVEHLGGGGALAFHIFDWLAVEGFGGYLVGQETGIVGNVRNDGSSAKRVVDGQPCNNKNPVTNADTAALNCEPQLPDMWLTTWYAGGDVQWAPIYGKISAVSEYDLNFQLYALAGAGAEGIARHANTDPNVLEDGGIRFTANYGLGVRLIPWKYVALRAELRNYNGLNPNVAEHESRDEGDCATGYTLTEGPNRNCFPDISNNTMFQVGLSLLL